jgi:hypothetical protein
LCDAEPGEIVRFKKDKKVTPLGLSENLLAAGSVGQVMKDTMMFGVGGEMVPCWFVQFGLVIRQDDYENLKGIFKRKMKKIASDLTTVPEAALRLGIRAIWPGQSYGSMLRIGDQGVVEETPRKELAEFHVKRLNSLCGIYFSIYIVF